MVFIRKSQENLLFVTEKCIINHNNATLKNDITEIINKLPKSNEEQNKIKQIEGNSSAITSVEFSNDFKYFVITKENKHVLVYNKELQIIKQFLSHRSPSKACFTHSNDIIVADKTGDVYLHKLKEQEAEGPVLLLGHSSMILDLILSECGKYVITCDRDEKIRVSRFPNSYNIESYCLGHTEFVISLKMCNSVLISASGDGTVRFWNYLNGKQCGIINTHQYIKDKTMLNKFTEEMDAEKVEITALPIMEMQVNHVKQNEVLIATKIYKYDFLQVYCTNLTSFKNSLLQNITCGPDFSFYLQSDISSSYLYVLCASGLMRYENKANSIFESSKNNFNEFYEQYKSYLQINGLSNIVTLYKRKFDNMQEYLERKKMRLELK